MGSSLAYIQYIEISSRRTEYWTIDTSRRALLNLLLAAAVNDQAPELDRAQAEKREAMCQKEAWRFMWGIYMLPTILEDLDNYLTL